MVKIVKLTPTAAVRTPAVPNIAATAQGKKEKNKQQPQPYFRRNRYADQGTVHSGAEENAKKHLS
jgi:hypothetical protein